MLLRGTPCFSADEELELVPDWARRQMQRVIGGAKGQATAALTGRRAFRAPQGVPSPTRTGKAYACASASTVLSRRHSPSTAPPCGGGYRGERTAGTGAWCCRATTPASAPPSLAAFFFARCLAFVRHRFPSLLFSLHCLRSFLFELLERPPIEPVEPLEGDLPEARSVGMHDPEPGDAANSGEPDPLAIW